ncbi:hypothetical protein ACSS6W_000636 [Trichoderma asperelloides]
MDEESSPPTLPFQPSVASGSSGSVPLQTTYTTAGTIYNPSSSQRLQPPARRGRLLKATSDFDNLKFPNSPLPRHQPDALHRLYMSGNLAQTQAPPDRQISYEPLQQNYDRAVSPVSTQDQASGMSSSMSVQSSAPMFDVKGKGIAVDASSSDDEDGIITSALMNMTVKSLQNLASYPNPNQKSAQKALLRGTKPRGYSTLSVPSRLDTPSTYRNASPVGGSVPLGEYLPPHMRSRLHAFSDPATFRFPKSRKSARVTISETAANGDYNNTIASSSWLSTPSIHSDSSDLHLSTSMSLAASAGAPKPLTAGPPGQRQYRPSTFESTFKALSTMPTDSQGIFAQVQEEDNYLSLDSLYRLTETPMTTQDYIAQDEEFIPYFRSSTAEAFGATPTPIQNEIDNVAEDSVLPRETLQYYPGYSDFEDSPDADELQYSSVPSKWTCQANGNGDGEQLYYSIAQREADFNSIDPYTPQATAASSLSNVWSNYYDRVLREPTTPMFPQCMGHPACLTEAEIRERTRQTHIKWYAATGLLGDAYPLPKPIVEPTYPPRPKNIYGAVGDGRPSKASSASGESDEASVENMQSQSSKDQVKSELALLDTVLGRANLNPRRGNRVEKWN